MDHAAGRCPSAIRVSILVLLLGCVGLAVWYAFTTLPKPRNVILISLDTLRPDHLGVYGYSRDTSPTLDLLSQQSFVFERALAPAPNTPPSQMSMMTSLYPVQHGFTGLNDRLAPQFATLAERMQAIGFRTAGFVDGGYLRARFGFNRGFDVYDQSGGGFASILPLATNWLEARGDEPFFLFLHTYDIHAPYVSRPGFRGMFIDQPYGGSFVPTVDNMRKAFEKKIQLDDADMRYITSLYDQGIRYTDTRLGVFIRYLMDQGYLDDTALIITSDHGEEFGEHGSTLHWQVFFQPNLRIPLIIPNARRHKPRDSYRLPGRTHRSTADDPRLGRRRTPAGRSGDELRRHDGATRITAGRVGCSGN